MAGSEPNRATVYNKPGVGARKMEATRFFAAFLLLIGIFVGIYLYTMNRKAITALGVPIVALVAAGFLYGVKAMGNKADELSRRALDARRGAVAEEDVGALLGTLPKGYFVFHDFLSNRGNIDHVVVSPKGIFTIETKSHRGVVTFDGDKLRRDGKIFEKDFIKQAWAQAFNIRDLMAQEGIESHKPQPVILFANADVRVREKAKGVEIIGRQYLPAYLEKLQVCMTRKDAERIFEVLKISQAQMFV